MAKTDKLGTVDSTPGNLTAGEGAPELVGPLVTVSQMVVETLTIPPSASRVSQFVVEVLQVAPAPTRVSQFVVEVLQFDPSAAPDVGGGPFAGDVGGAVWIE